jgi:hypothetical protein
MALILVEKGTFRGASGVRVINWRWVREGFASWVTPGRAANERDGIGRGAANLGVLTGAATPLPARTALTRGLIDGWGMISARAICPALSRMTWFLMS